MLEWLEDRWSSTVSLPAPAVPADVKVGSRRQHDGAERAASVRK